MTTAVDNGAGLGHVGVSLVFRNTSTTTCTLRAYAGVAGLDGAGKQVVQAKRAAGGYLYPDRPVTTISLKPGGYANAGLEGTDNPVGSMSCTTVVGLLVTPPNETHSVRLKDELNACAENGLSIHPLAAGQPKKD